MKLCELIFEKEYNTLSDISDTEIKTVTSSLNKIDSNTLFVFIKSIKFDITKIINCVSELKPKAILCDEDLQISDSEIPIIRCRNTRALLPYIYAKNQPR